mgnify:CR=1 FL=1
MEKLEAKLKAVDWAVRDVLVGTMRSLQQLDICRKDCFYYIPAERLQDSDFPIAMCPYQHSMCRRTGRCPVLRRSHEMQRRPPECYHRDQPRRGTEGNFYYRFDIREWKQLNRPLRQKKRLCRDLPTCSCWSTVSRRRELWVRTEEEYRLCSALKRASGVTPSTNRTTALHLNSGLHRSFAEGKNFRFRRRPRFCAV